MSISLPLSLSLALFFFLTEHWPVSLSFLRPIFASYSSKARWWFECPSGGQSIGGESAVVFSLSQPDRVTLAAREGERKRNSGQLTTNAGWLGHNQTSGVWTEWIRLATSQLNVHVWSIYSPLSIQKPSEVKWKQNKRPSGVPVMFAREKAIGPIER